MTLTRDLCLNAQRCYISVCLQMHVYLSSGFSYVLRRNIRPTLSDDTKKIQQAYSAINITLLSTSKYSRRPLLAVVPTSAKLTFLTCATFPLILSRPRHWSKQQSMNGTNLEAPHYVLLCTYILLSLYYLQILSSTFPQHSPTARFVPCFIDQGWCPHTWHTYNSFCLTRLVDTVNLNTLSSYSEINK